MKKTKFKKPEETFYATTGIDSFAGEVLRERLDTKEYKRFVALITKFSNQLKLSQSKLVDDLLYNHFRDSVLRTEMESFKLNALKVAFNTHRNK